MFSQGREKNENEIVIVAEKVPEEIVKKKKTMYDKINIKKKRDVNMTDIASDTSAAERATAGIKDVSINKGTQATLEESTVSSMTTGTEVNNQLLTDLSQLIDCVKEQSQKFPKIAELMAIEDSKIQF